MCHENRGKIFDIHRLSTHDGPGMRATVFMKGCSLKCTWCHNPESIHSYDELQWLKNKCIGCGACVKTCHQNALTQSDQGIKIDRNKCNRCMNCVTACPTGAMNKLGENTTVNAVIEEILQDRLFYENSGGGVTISGGEPLLQVDFVLELLVQLKNEGIHTAIDTSLQVPISSITKVMPYVDLWLVDMKETNREKQIGFLGTSTEMIEDNFATLISALPEVNSNGKIWVRTPLIPEMTAREENIVEIGQMVNKMNNGSIELWELCTFNNMCGDKYNKLDLDWSLKNLALLSSEEKVMYDALARDVADGSYDIKVSGLTR